MVKASALEFRFRSLLMGVIYLLGFWAPWNLVVPLDPPGVNAHVWGLLAVNLTQVGVPGLFTAFNILLSLAIAFAIAGAALRTWGAAYLGAEVVSSGVMQAGDGIVKDGPYGYLRNPLYLGLFLHTFAVALLMSRIGAIFSLVAVAVLSVRLILAEEAFLQGKLGASYAAYCGMVPRLVPAVRRKVAATGAAARWPQALLGEIYFWGVAIALSIAGWRYNAALLIQCVVVSLGVSIVFKALTAKR